MIFNIPLNHYRINDDDADADVENDWSGLLKSLQRFWGCNFLHPTNPANDKNQKKNYDDDEAGNGDHFWANIVF